MSARGKPDASQTVVGAALVLLGVIGLGYSICAGFAHIGVYRLRHGALGAEGCDMRRALAVAERCHRLYPRNFYLAVWAGPAIAYRDGTGLSPEERHRLADLWVSRGLALNPYRRVLRLLRARLMCETSPKAAAEYWEQYVDWHYWDAFNHAMLVEFFAKSGQIVKAMQSLSMTRGSPYYDGAHQEITAAWTREKEMPR